MRDSKIKEYNEISNETLKNFDNFKKLWEVFIKEKQNIVCETLLVGIKNQMNIIFDNFNKTNKIINSKPKEIDSKGNRFDIVREDGKIELGLYSANKETLNKVFEMSGEKFGILREINEYGEIIFEDLELIRKYQPFVTERKETTAKGEDIVNQMTEGKVELSEETIKNWADKVNNRNEEPNVDKNISSDANINLWVDIINGKKDSFGRDKKKHMKEVVERSKKFHEENKDVIEKLTQNVSKDEIPTMNGMINKALHEAVVKFKEKESKKTKKNKKNPKKK